VAIATPVRHKRHMRFLTSAPTFRGGDQLPLTRPSRASVAYVTSCACRVRRHGDVISHVDSLLLASAAVPVDVDVYKLDLSHSESRCRDVFEMAGYATANPPRPHDPAHTLRDFLGHSMSWRHGGLRHAVDDDDDEDEAGDSQQRQHPDVLMPAAL